MSPQTRAFLSTCKRWELIAGTILAIVGVISLLVSSGRWIEQVSAAPTDAEVAEAINSATAPLETREAHEKDIAGLKGEVNALRDEVRTGNAELNRKLDHQTDLIIKYMEASR